MHMSDLRAGVGPDGRSGFSNANVANSLDIAIEEDHEAAFRDDLRAAKGIGRPKSKRKVLYAVLPKAFNLFLLQRRPRNEPILSIEVKSLIGKGSQAYVDQQVDLAINTMQEVIRIEPRASSAWSVLIACYRDLGQLDKVLQLGIMSAHLNGDYAQWFKLGEESKERGFINQALYCYRKASILDPTIPDADWERAVLAKGIGDLRNVSFDFSGHFVVP
jgi:general transcription factor 3C polypeptide 3 (transcription factor C subunit 4)